MPALNQGDLVRIPIQTEPVVEVDRSGQAPELTGRVKRTWFQFLQSLYTRGFWNPVEHASTYYTANGSMTWTVQAADQTTFAFTQMGKTLVVAFVLTSTTVGGVANSTLQITIPKGHVAARTMVAPVWISDNGTATTGIATVTANSTVIAIQRTDGANFALATNTTAVRGQITLEVQG